jgi:putative thioredoxin
MQGTLFDFQKDVLDASRQIPIVVDFWAEWCAPCRVLGPVLEKLAREAAGAWKLVKLNTDEHPQIAMQFGIRSIPAVKLFHEGQVLAEFIGALPEARVRKWLDENLPSRSKKLLEKARAELARGNRRLARELLETIVKEDDKNLEAKILLAELLFADDPAKAGQLVKDAPAEHPLRNRASALVTLSRLINDFDSLDAAARRGGAPPDGQSAAAWDFYLKGIQELRRRNYEMALQNWIDALAIDRTIADDGPRRACIALFTWLGPEHELTRKYHRAFTSALF